MLKIVCISDTHDEHDRLTIPECDILIHSGDATSTGSLRRMVKFGNWLNSQLGKAKEIVFVPGNHDRLAEQDWGLFRSCFDPKIHILNNENAVVAGLRFWGCAYTPAYGDWAFQACDEGEEAYSRFPSLTRMQMSIQGAIDVVVTHGPPRGILDITSEGDCIGSVSMKNLIDSMKPKLYVCGHCHSSYGRVNIFHGHTGEKTTVVNASSIIEGDDWKVLGTQQPVEVYL